MGAKEAYLRAPLSMSQLSNDRFWFNLEIGNTEPQALITCPAVNCNYQKVVGWVVVLILPRRSIAACASSECGWLVGGLET